MLEALVLTALIAAPDTSFVAAERHRDLTGDGVDEVMRLEASGDPADSLEMVLTIRSGGRELYRDSFTVDRTIGFGSTRRIATDDEWAEIRVFYGSEFFADSRLRTPRETVARLRQDTESVPRGVDLTPSEWSRLLESTLPAFQYSPGGDRILGLAWHEASREFVDVLQCC